MSVLSRVNGYVRNYRDAMYRRRTERLIGTLPPEIRKDIGWPGHYDRNQGSFLADGRDNRGI